MQLQRTLMYEPVGKNREPWLQSSRLNSALRMIVVLGGMAIIASGCVQSTIGETDTRVEPAAISQSEKPPTYDPVQREQAIAEIREKAGHSSGELTNAFAPGDGPAEAMTKSEQNSLIEELEKDAAKNSGSINDAELTERQRAIRAMQNKASSHYKNAVNTIQN